MWSGSDLRLVSDGAGPGRLRFFSTIAREFLLPLLACLIVTAVLLLPAQAMSAPPSPPPPWDNPANPYVDIHDPAIGVDHGSYFLYSTGVGIDFYSSRDRLHWVYRGKVFSALPAWAKKVTAQPVGAIWAPDVIKRGDTYYLYYSVSGFGKNDSTIGLATNKTLDPASPDYKWVDQGMVLRSVAGRDDWNAIDPNLIVDQAGTAWMDFGSFWSGIKLVQLNKNWTGVAEPQKWFPLASRSRPLFRDMKKAGSGAVEGPFLFSHGGYYYLFVSTGLCCRGKNSTYRMAYGRAKKITGPYLDKKGRNMARGGGARLLPENKKWAGWGGQSVYHFDDGDYVVFHAYENAGNDFHRLKILKIHWQDGWPEVDPAAIDHFIARLQK